MNGLSNAGEGSSRKQEAGAGYTQFDADIERDGDAVTHVWNGNIGWTGQLPKMYASVYLDCPFGRPMLKLLRHEDSGAIVGTFGIGPRRILWGGKEVRAGVASHICVLPAHRKVKPAVLLLRSLTEEGAERFDVLYGIPNHRGAAGSRLAGYKVGAELIRHVKVLRYQDYLRRHLPRPIAAVGGSALNFANRARDFMRQKLAKDRSHYEWVDRVDPRMEQLWQGAPKGDGWLTIRDTCMLQWRFDQMPSLCRCYLLIGAERGGDLSAWFVCDTNVHDPHMLTVNDFWSDHGVRAIDPEAIRILCRAAYDKGFHAIELHFTGAQAIHASWAAEGFVERSRQPMFINWYNPDMAGDVSGNLHITDIELES